ncbi:hypothetical protein PBOI14_39480 [Pseudomonas sp. Boi14]|nr:hypothetical protein PBOI14_39480 [Pseudomonas sp. Boi14]
MYRRHCAHEYPDHRAAGFIGAHTALRLLKDGHQVTGLDNFNDYYDPQLKRDRVRWVERQVGHFPLQRLDLADSEGLERLFAEVRPQVVINLAAQAGVRYSLENPKAYLDSNLSGFLNLLEMCRRYPVQHLIYASSSSVYGPTSRPRTRSVTTSTTRCRCMRPARKPTS